MRTLVAAGVVVIAGLAAPGASPAATVSLAGGSDQVVVTDTEADFNVLLVTATDEAYTVTEEGFGDPVLVAGSGCTGGGPGSPSAPAVVTCERTAPTPTGTKAEVRLGSGNGSFPQRVTIGSGVGDAEVWGGADKDELFGGAGDDFLYGDDGDDDVAGNDGRDQVYGANGNDTVEGGEDPDQLIGGLGSDDILDLGSSGGDIASYVATQDAGRTTGVDVTLDGTRNDGSEADDGALDNLIEGIEAVGGTDFDDVLEGDAHANSLSGYLGDDVLTGHGGADTMHGHGGEDTLNADDGQADARLDCNNSDASRGTGPNTAVIDRGLDDGAVTDCSTVLPEQAGGTPHTPHTPAPTPGGATVVTPGPIATTPARPFFALAATGGTTIVSRMPNVVGVKAAKARERVLAALPNADLDVDFRRGCREAQDTEIVRQSPVRGRAVTSHVRDAVAVKLVMCLADRDFLRDCDLGSLRQDVRQLRGRTDAEFVDAILGAVARCKVDYDVRMARQAREAEIALAVQKATRRSKRGEIRAAIDCPTSPSQTDLRVYVGEDHVTGRLDTSFGLRASGPDGWTLPAGFESYVTLEGIDRSFRFLGNPTTYIDADDVTSKGNTRRRQVREWRDGRLVFGLAAERAGTIKLCTIMETGGDEVLAHALEIRVVPRPKNGSLWETIGGRVIEVGPTGGRWLTTAEASARRGARAAFLDRFFTWIGSLFDGRSRSVTAAASEQTTSRRKTEAVYTGGKAGTAQLTLNGKLVGDPVPPVLREGPCFITQADGTVTLGTCMQLQPAAGANALLGRSLSGIPIVAAGAGNIVAAGAGNIVAAGAGNLVGPDGASLIGPDGATLVGPDGASLTAAQLTAMVAAGAGNIVAAGAGNMVAAGGGNAIAVAPAQMVAAGAGNMVAAGAGNLVRPGGMG